MKKTNGKSTTGGISRRSFLRLSFASIAFLPTVASASALPTEVAFAEEAEPRAVLANGTTIYIVSPRELGLVVRDVSVSDGSPNYVTGATVRIRSRYNDAVLEGVTDDSGVVSFDISDLAEDEGKNATLARYAFNATVEVSAQGYRDFCASLMRVEGGTTLEIPTQPTQGGIPYPMSASFDEWDVLYTTGDAATFVSSTGNDTAHTIAVDLRDCPSDVPVAAELFCDGASILKTNTKSASDGTASINFTDTYLHSSSSAALPVGEGHEYALRYTVNKTTYEVPIKLDVTAAPPDAQDPQLKKDLSLTPFNADGFKLGFDVPKDWPLIGGSKLKLWEPQFPLWASFDPFGFLRFRATSPEFGYANVYGKPDKSGWQRVPRKAVKQQFMDAWSAMGDQTMETFNSMTRVNEDGKMNTFRQTSFAGKFTFMSQIEGLAMATWDWGGEESRGRAQLAVRAGANYSLTETFWAGPFPVIIRFGVGLNMVVAGMVGFIGEHVWKPWEWRWDYTSTGFDLQLCFPPTLSVGVGIAGVCSISARGTITVTFNLHYGPLPKGFEDREPVHLRLAASVGLNIEAEALFFTYSYKLTGKDWPDWYDNWATNSALQEGADDPAAEGLMTPQPLASLNGGKIITEDSLAELAEFQTAGLQDAEQHQELVSYALVEQTTQDEMPVERPVAWLFMAPDVVEGSSTTQANGADIVPAAEKDVVPTEEDAIVPAESADVVLGTEEDVVLDEEDVALAEEDAIVPAESADIVPAAEEDVVPAESAEAQSNDQPTLVLKRASDLLESTGPLNAEQSITFFETSEVVASPTGDHSYAEIPQGPIDVLQLGLEQGFRPTIDVRMAQNILASSHLKLFTVGASDYVARIGVVMVAGNPRTRIICETATGGDRRVLDFSSTYRDDDCYDYDFDIASTVVDGKEVVNLVVISGKREAGDATTFASAATETFFSFVTCTNWEGNRTFAGATVIGSAVDPFGTDTTFPARNYSCPRLVQIKGTKNGREYGQATVAFLTRAAVREDEIMSSDPDLAQAAASLIFFADGDRTIDVTGVSEFMRPLATQIIDPTITEIALSGRANGYQLLELKGTEQTHYVLLETDPCWYVFASGRAIPRLLGTTVIDLGEYAGRLTRLIPMEGGSYFLTCVDGMLKRADFAANEGQAPVLEISDFGGAELNMNDFGALDGGNVLYWPAARENGGYTFEDETAAPRLREDDGKLSQIVGARVVNGKLSKAFALCEVDHTIDRIRHYGNSQDHMSFISSSTVDLETGRGEQWYTAVPWVRCANLLEAHPYTTMVAKGDYLPFYVALRNDGNCYLTGVELTVAEADGADIGTILLDFCEDTLVASEWNPPSEDGTLQNVEDDWALAPGTTSRYYAASVAIPEDWEGQKQLEVYVTAAYGSAMRAEDGLLAEASESSIEFLPDKRATSTIMLPGGTSFSAGQEDPELTRADVAKVRG